MPPRADFIKVSLGIPELSILEINEQADKIIVMVKRRHDFEICPGCGRLSDRRHSEWTSTVQDLPMSGKKVFLKVVKRRFRCLNGCRVFSEIFGSLDFYQRQTKRFQDHIQKNGLGISVKKNSMDMMVGYKVAERIYNERALASAKCLGKQALPAVLGIDEFRGKKNMRYHLSLTDMSEKGAAKLWDIFPRKDCVDFIGRFKRYSREECKAVVAVVHDMDQGLRSWTRILFPLAIHVADKFHVVRCLHKHFERVRQNEMERDFKKRQAISGTYYLFKKRKEKLSDEQKNKIETAINASPLLKTAYEFKEDFMSWYDQPKRRSFAKDELDVLNDRLEKIKYMKRFKWALVNWHDEILNYFATGYTNAYTEGLNNKLKVIRRTAFGYRNFEHYRARVLLECRA